MINLFINCISNLIINNNKGVYSILFLFFWYDFSEWVCAQDCSTFKTIHGYSPLVMVFSFLIRFFFLIIKKSKIHNTIL